MKTGNKTNVIKVPMICGWDAVSTGWNTAVAIRAIKKANPGAVVEATEGEGNLSESNLKIWMDVANK